MEKNRGDLKKWMILIITAIVGYWAINNLGVIGNCLSKIISIIFPFILGACLAFILNIPMTFFERRLSRLKNKRGRIFKNKKMLRIVSMILAFVVIIFIISLIINLIVPELINIVKLLIDNIPYYTEEISKIIENSEENIPDIMSLMEEIDINIETIKNELKNIIPDLLTSSISIIINIFNGIVDFIISVIFAVYILTGKEKLQAQLKKILYAYFKKEKADKIISVGRVTNNTFISFFTVQCLEATILGSLCIIGMLILKIPYAVSIGILIGVTALIPVVGAFLGAIIGAILIVSVNPFKVITFVIFVIILQQVEGNLIYPRVVGNSVGLPGMWVLVAVTIGGSMFGILGMLLGVPLVSVIYILIKKDVNKKIEVNLEKSNTI